MILRTSRRWSGSIPVDDGGHLRLESAGDEDVEYCRAARRGVLEIVGHAGWNAEKRPGRRVDTLIANQEGHCSFHDIEQFLIRLMVVGTRSWTVGSDAPDRDAISVRAFGAVRKERRVHRAALVVTRLSWRH